MSARVEAIGPQSLNRSPSLVVRWYVLIITVLVYTISIADRYVVSTVLEPIRLELQLTDAGVAFLSAIPLAFFYVSFGIPISWLTDRWNRRNIMAVSLAAWSAMTLLCGTARNYWQFLTARIGVGVGEAGGTPAANSIVSDYFPAARRPMALTIFSLGAPIGAWLAASFAGRILDLYGWRAVFLALGVPGVVLAGVIYLTVREPRRGQLDQASTGAAPSFWVTLKFLLEQRSAVHLIVGSAITAMWGWGLTYWTPTFLLRSYGLSAGAAAEVVAPMHLYGGIAATLLTGWLLALPVMKDQRRVVWLLAGGIAVATVPSIVIFYTHSFRLAVQMFWIFIPSIYFYIGPCFGILNNLAPPRMRAQFCAVTLLVANVGNLIVAPYVVGLLSDWFAPNHISNAASLRLALLCLAPTGFWAAYHLFICSRRLEADHQRALDAT